MAPAGFDGDAESEAGVLVAGYDLAEALGGCKYESLLGSLRVGGLRWDFGIRRTYVCCSRCDFNRHIVPIVVFPRVVNCSRRAQCRCRKVARGRQFRERALCLSLDAAGGDCRYAWEEEVEHWRGAALVSELEEGSCCRCRGRGCCCAAP